MHLGSTIFAECGTHEPSRALSFCDRQDEIVAAWGGDIHLQRCAGRVNKVDDPRVSSLRRFAKAMGIAVKDLF